MISVTAGVKFLLPTMNEINRKYREKNVYATVLSNDKIRQH